MPLRRFIARLVLCLAFLVASSYVQAMAHVDNDGVSTSVGKAKTKLPPCHHPMNDDKDKGVHHNGCCSNFACAVGLISYTTILFPPRAAAAHDIDYGDVAQSASRQPLNPPPKSA